MTPDTLFDILDLNHDGQLSRAELHKAAKRLAWHWHEAPLFAVLDLYSLYQPITRNQFGTILHQIMNDPLGPYGKVLRQSPHFIRALTKNRSQQALEPANTQHSHSQSTLTLEKNRLGNGLKSFRQTAGTDTANQYQRLLQDLGTVQIIPDKAMALIIDPQRSFTQGAWMQSIGAQAESDVAPIQLAFNSCAAFLKQFYRRMDIMFTRCPFPPESYLWEHQLANIIDPSQLYFIKPGNSVLFPPLNGFRQWVNKGIDRGKRFLIMGGCTLNSCIRVSAMESQAHFIDNQLQVVVDLRLCGARARNFKSSAMYGGLSAVESAIHQMQTAGIEVVSGIEWQ